MPQMAPLLWLNLYMFFILSFLIFNILNFYNFKYNNSSNKISSLKNNTLNFLWKW